MLAAVNHIAAAPRRAGIHWECRLVAVAIQLVLHFITGLRKHVKGLFLEIVEMDGLHFIILDVTTTHSVD